MNPRTWSLKWMAAFAGAAIVGAVGVVVVLSVMSGGSGQVTAQGGASTATPVATGIAETPVPLGTTSPVTPGPTAATQTPSNVRPAAIYYPLHIPTVPPSLAVTPLRACPDTWQRINDDVLNYSICIPPDWGILDESTGERSTRLAVHDEDLKILSAEGFPYPVGVSIDKLLQDPSRNLIYIAMGSTPPNSYLVCDAQPRAPVGSLPAVECQFRFNYTAGGVADHRSDGNMVETDTVVALPNPEPGPFGSRAGDGLFIAVVGSQRAVQVYGDTISQILDTVEGQP